MANDPARGSSLLPQHVRLIEDSAISPQVATARGYRSITIHAELARLGFSKRQCRVPCLLIPVHNVHGEVATYQIRPDTPRITRHGTPTKYDTPAGSRMVLDVPQMARPWIRDPMRPLFVTEGVRKADAAVSKGICCIDLLGVWNWRGRNDDGGLTALADWESIALKQRQVFIAFDSDVVVKIEVGRALRRLREFLTSRGAEVRVIRLPLGPGGSKVGLDDYLAAGHDINDLLALVGDLPDPPAAESAETYQATATGLVYQKPTKEGAVPVQLTNFNAHIVRETAHDDGQERSLHFGIAARLGRTERDFDVPAKQFPSLGWVMEHLGASAIVYPGAPDHARCAIQSLSTDIERRSVYTHLGWRELDGTPVFLHVGGAIGPRGPIREIDVAPPSELGRFVLPGPPTGSALVEAVRSSLGVLDLLPLRVTVPVLAAVYRAPLGASHATVHVVGPTGEGKTELAALAQQHYGAGLVARELPASWLSTGNALEVIAFAAKDVLLVVDDFVPRGGQIEVNRLHREAERLLRAQANAAGRQRLRSDGTLRATKPPRGLILSTGEDIPRGHSLRARIVIVEVAPGDMNWAALDDVQTTAAGGALARAMSAYVQWLARRWQDVRRELAGEVEALRALFAPECHHKRTASTVADLAVGLRLFLRFAEDAGAVGRNGAEPLWTTWWSALIEIAAAQGRHQQAEEPTRRFLDLLTAAISSGRAHVAGKDGNAPASAHTWGWRPRAVVKGQIEHEGWSPHGDCVGWLDEDDLYLEPVASYTAAQRQARESGDSLEIQPRTLHKRLAERGFLASRETCRETFTVRRSLAGARRAVLHLRAGSLMRQEPDQPDQPPEDESETPDSDAKRWSGSWSGPGRDLTNDLTTPQAEISAEVPAGPTSGQVGQVSGEEESRRSTEGGAPPERFEL